MTIDYAHYLNNSLLTRRDHPTLPLIVWNYTAKTAANREWDAVTLSHRGLVTDLLGRVVSHCIPKFFNVGEMDALPDGEPEIWEKLDGSYISVSNWKGERVVASRGSFQSEHVARAEKLLEDFLPPPGWTDIFELVSPELRIVVEYLQEELVYLTSFSPEGEEHHLASRTAPVTPTSKVFRPAKRFDVMEEDVPNEEGYVLRWPDGTRAKVKHDWYVKAHRIVTGMSPHRLAEAVFFGDYFIDDLPAELQPAWRVRWQQVEHDRARLLNDAMDFYAQIPSGLSRKDFAEVAKTLGMPFTPLMFAMLDGAEGKVENIIQRTLLDRYSGQSYFGTGDFDA